jgi:hypothetical protein
LDPALTEKAIVFILAARSGLSNGVKGTQKISFTYLDNSLFDDYLNGSAKGLFFIC